MTEEVLLLDQLVKRYDANTVLKGVSTEVFRGDVIGLLGLNGAGKTTLLETALGFCLPDGGIVDDLLVYRRRFTIEAHNGQHAGAVAHGVEPRVWVTANEDVAAE